MDKYTVLDGEEDEVSKKMRKAINPNEDRSAEAAVQPRREP